MSGLDYGVLGFFLLLTLLVGAYAGRQIVDIKSFAVGGRNYGFFALFATLLASYIGGGYTFGISEKTFNSGIAYAFCLLGVSVQLFFVACFIAPKMKHFHNAYSVGDIMEKLYGPKARLLTGFCSTIVCAGIIGAQVKATGFVFNLFLCLETTVGIMIGCGIVVAYAVYGGMRAVVATDILQFCVLAVAIPLTLWFGLQYVGGFDRLVAVMPQGHFEVPGALGTWAMLSLFLSLFLGEAMVPPYVQRLFIAKDTQTTVRGTFASSLTSIPFFIIAGLIGMVAFAINSNLDPNLSLPFVVQTVLPVGLRGLAVAGIIACVMSTADSHLNSAAIAIVHDLIKPLRARSMSGERELSLTRIFTLLIGLFAIVFAISIESALDILLYSYNFWAPVILIPLVLGIMGVRAKPQAFFLSAFAGITSVVMWNIYYSNTSGFDGLVVGVGVNLMVFLATHMFFKVKSFNAQ